MRKGERGMETVRMCTQRQVQRVLQKWALEGTMERQSAAAGRSASCRVTVVWRLCSMAPAPASHHAAANQARGREQDDRQVSIARGSSQPVCCSLCATWLPTLCKLLA